MRIIDGKRYDPDAEGTVEIARCYQGGVTSYWYRARTLYRTARGAYFLVDAEWQREQYWEVFDEAQAREWVGAYEPEKYEEIFEKAEDA